MKRKWDRSPIYQGALLGPSNIKKDAARNAKRSGEIVAEDSLTSGEPVKQRDTHLHGQHTGPVKANITGPATVNKNTQVIQNPLLRPSKDRVWPRDWTIKEIADGFDVITRGCNLKPPQTQKELFPEIFGRPYHKTTVCMVRIKYNNASDSLRNRFRGYGITHRGLWGQFLMALRVSSPGSSDNEDERACTVSDTESKWPETLDQVPRASSSVSAGRKGIHAKDEKSDVPYQVMMQDGEEILVID